MVEDIDSQLAELELVDGPCIRIKHSVWTAAEAAVQTLCFMRIEWLKFPNSVPARIKRKSLGSVSFLGVIEYELSKRGKFVSSGDFSSSSSPPPPFRGGFMGFYGFWTRRFSNTSSWKYFCAKTHKALDETLKLWVYGFWDDLWVLWVLPTLYGFQPAHRNTLTGPPGESSLGFGVFNLLWRQCL